MSTKIYNGYMVPFSNSKKVEVVNERLRTIFTQLFQEYSIKKIVDIASLTGNYYMNTKLPNFEKSTCLTYIDFFKKHILDLDDGLAFEAYKKSARSNNDSIFGTALAIVKGFSEYNIESRLNVKNQAIYFKTVGKRTVYYFAVDSDIISAFEEINKKENIVEDFCYFNNSDRPDNVKSSEWQLRRKVWDSVLKKSFTLSGVMNQIPINVDLHINREDIIDYLPDEHSRLKTIYKRTRVDELMRQLKAERSAEFEGKVDFSCYTSLFFDASEVVMEEMSNGIYLTSEQHKNMLDNQEDFIKKLFEEDNNLKTV